jgi:hypothetical protein
LQVGVNIGGDVAKLLADYGVDVAATADLSDAAHGRQLRCVDGITANIENKRWSLAGVRCLVHWDRCFWQIGMPDRATMPGVCCDVSFKVCGGCRHSLIWLWLVCSAKQWPPAALRGWHHSKH